MSGDGPRVLRATRHDVPSSLFLSSLAREVKNLVIGIPEANFLDLSRSARRQSRKSTRGNFEGFSSQAERTTSI